ncbi:unnamed protein product, partial [Meganyctiphanes norvegica]
MGSLKLPNTGLMSRSSTSGIQAPSTTQTQPSQAKRKTTDASVILTEDTDSFIIGNRVWVGGTKGGSISYIGETQFAPGEWAGITLDEPIGKNDGSVAGVRYFQCEPKKGVFSRLTRLSRTPLTDHDIEAMASKSSTAGSDSPKANGTPTPSVTSGQTAGRNNSTSSVPTTPAARKVTPASTATPAAKVPSPMTSSVIRKTSSSSPISGELKIGDRVVINSTTGVKFGVLRYRGPTEFAEGEWAGVELDEPTGKNDGSVAGKRYFDCKQKYGLFAPIARVSRFTGGSATPRRSSTTTPATPSRLRRSGSRESIGASSVASSTTSSVRGTRRPSRTSTGSSSVPNTKALQEALAEKTQHVDQLMRERDVERAEVARMAQQIDQSARQAQDLQIHLDQLQVESEERLHDLNSRIGQMEKERESLMTKLEDKQRELDDLNFRLEEEEINKTDLESQSTTDAEKIREMKKKLEENMKAVTLREKAFDKVEENEELELGLHKSIDDMQSRIYDMERDKENSKKEVYEAQEQIKSLEMSNEALKNKVSEGEQKIKLLETDHEENQKSSKEKTSELGAQTQLVISLQEKLEEKAKEFEDISQQAEEFLTDFEKEKKDKDKLQSELADMKSQLMSGSTQASNLSDEISILKAKLEEALGQLTEAKENLSATELSKKNLQLELSSSSSSVSDTTKELTNLNTQLAEKDKQITNLEGKIFNLESSHKTDTECHTKEMVTVNKALQEAQEKHQQEKHELQDRANESVRQIAALETKISILEETRKNLDNQVSESLSQSTDSSQQLTNLNNQLRRKEKELETNAEKLTISKDSLACERKKRKAEQDAAHKTLEEVKQKHEDMILDIQNKMNKLESQLEAGRTSVENMKITHSEVLEELTKKKDLEIYEVQEQAMLNETKLKSMEASIAELQSETAERQGSLEGSLAQLITEKENVAKEKEQMMKDKELLEAEVAILEGENSKLHTEQEANLLAVTERDQKVVALTSEVERLSS